MRFTKQLAVCIVAVAAFAIPPAAAWAKCSISGDDPTEPEWSELSKKGPFGAISEVILFGGLIVPKADLAAHIKACDTPPYAGYLGCTLQIG